MLPSAFTLNSQLLSLPESDNSFQAATNFINIISSFIDQIQAGATGSPGIFIYSKPNPISMIQAMQPVDDNSWIINFANAIHSGSVSATLVSGTVVDPVWTASEVDVLIPTITNLSDALNVLISGLNNVNSTNNPPMPLAQAIYNYASTFIFQCTGLVAGTSPTPLPLTFSAQ